MLGIRRRHALWLTAAILLILQWSLPANASVTCAVRKRGQYVCTFFCQNGFVCDNDNLRCLPGPAIKKNLSDLQEKARVATRENNKTQVKYARQRNSQSTGHDLGSTYYRWNGDPRVMPTPRHRQGGGFTQLPSGGYATVRQSLQTRIAMRTPTVSVSVPSVRTPTVSLPSIPSPTVSVPSVPNPTVRVPSVPPPTVRVTSARPSTGPNEPRKYWEEIDYCDISIERGAALYGYLCNPDQPSPVAKDDHKPFPDPQDLDRKVSQMCGSYSRDTRQCFHENKLKIILDTNPDIREACASKQGADSLRDQLRNKLRGNSDEGDPNENSYTRCVDDAYLHGLHPKSAGISLRDRLKQQLKERDENPRRTAANQNHNEPKRPPPEKLPNDGCGPGRGLKPDPKAFGAWTCQPLGGGFPGQGDRVAGVQDAGPIAQQDQANAVDPTNEELENYLNMINPNTGGNLRGDLGKRDFSWGTDDYLAIEKLQR